MEAYIIVLLSLTALVHDASSEDDLLKNCTAESGLEGAEADEVQEKFFQLDDISNMKDNVKDVYYCVLSGLGLIDEKYCINWDEVCEWYRDQLMMLFEDNSRVEEYMRNHEKEIRACDSTCGSEDNSANKMAMMTATKCVFDIMRKIPEEEPQS